MITRENHCSIFFCQKFDVVIGFLATFLFPLVLDMSKTLSDKERFQEILNTLNETQRESVLSDAQNLQILAGPGSGKTRGP